MKKASHILLIVGSIMAIFAALTFVIVGIVFIAVFSDLNAIVQAIQNGQVKVEGIPGTPEEQAKALQLLAYTIAIVFLVLVIPTIVCCILGFTSLGKEKTRGFCIAGIVLSVLSVNQVSLAGFILKLIVKIKSERAETLPE